MARILVLDDDERLRMMLASVLRHAGHEVFTAGDGDIGVSLCRDDPPDIVVTDIFMPRQKGTDTIVELRKRWPKIQIIAMSGGGLEGAADPLAAARACGAAHTFTKPVAWPAFLDAVEGLAAGLEP